MNRKSHFLSLTFALLLGVIGLRVAAQTESSSMAVDPDTRAKAQQSLQHMSSELNLTDDQKQKIQPILQTQFQQLKSVRNDASLSPDQKQAKAQEIRANCKSQIAPILTPDQQRKLAAMKEEKEKEK